MLIVEEYNESRQRQREDAITAAYLSAYWQRAKRMPSLKKVLEDLKPKLPQGPQSPEDMFAAVKRLQRQLSREEG